MKLLVQGCTASKQESQGSNLDGMTLSGPGTLYSETLQQRVSEGEAGGAWPESRHWPPAWARAEGLSLGWEDP